MVKEVGVKNSNITIFGVKEESGWSQLERYEV